MHPETSQTLPAIFFETAGRKATRPWLWSKQAGAWVPVTWAESARIVCRLARGLLALGLEAGDRVAIVMENRPEWVLADLAIMAAGGITVPLYTSYTTEDHRHVLADGDARFLILGSNALGQRVLPAADQLSGLAAVIHLETPKGQSRADAWRWSDVLEKGDAAPDDIDQRIAALRPEATACLIYTSGTGGVPKGVMLSHRNMLANAAGARKVLESGWRLGDEVFLSFLPLTHSYEHTAGFVFPLSIGGEIRFAQPETLAADIATVRPTIMTAVPRLCETLEKRVTQAAERQGGWRRHLFRETLRLGAKRHQGHLGLAERFEDAVLSLLVRRQIQRRFGGRLKAFVSGGAPLDPDTALFFVAIGIPLCQGYGQTEAGPVIAVNPPRAIRIESVGRPLDGVEVQIAEDGEILVRGPNVMTGYWRDAAGTGRAIRDGWLQTGDIGSLDAEGYLRITDRKRDFIKNSGGEMISPQRIEGLLTLQDGIAQAMVVGDRRPWLAALIVPDEAVAAGEVEGRIAAAIAAVNARLTPAERIRRHAVLTEPFTVANGQMTPTLKIRRHVIGQVYEEAIARLYEGGTLG